MHRHLQLPRQPCRIARTPSHGSLSSRTRTTLHPSAPVARARPATPLPTHRCRRRLSPVMQTEKRRWLNRARLRVRCTDARQHPRPSPIPPTPLNARRCPKERPLSRHGVPRRDRVDAVSASAQDVAIIRVPSVTNRCSRMHRHGKARSKVAGLLWLGPCDILAAQQELAWQQPLPFTWDAGQSSPRTPSSLYRARLRNRPFRPSPSGPRERASVPAHAEQRPRVRRGRPGPRSPSRYPGPAMQRTGEGDGYSPCTGLPRTCNATHMWDDGCNPCNAPSNSAPVTASPA